MRINWREVFKFLSGAFFVSAGTNWYFYQLHVAVPLPFPFLGFTTLSPDILGARALIHSALFFLCLYLGFIRKPARS
jgi:hypothetical protein